MKTKAQRIKEWTGRIDLIVWHYKRLDAMFGKLGELGMLDDDKPGGLHDVAWKAFEGLLDMIDLEGWLSWYIYNNGCGDNERKAGFGNKAKPIKTSRDLAKLMVESEDRE